MSDKPEGDGWWQGSDGQWYSPDLYPSDEPRGEGWWRASDGRWYAPQFHPNYAFQSGTTHARQSTQTGAGGDASLPNSEGSQPTSGGGASDATTRTASLGGGSSHGSGWWQATDGGWIRLSSTRVIRHGARAGGKRRMGCSMPPDSIPTSPAEAGQARRHKRRRLSLLTPQRPPRSSSGRHQTPL
jgi:hypothetical protein